MRALAILLAACLALAPAARAQEDPPARPKLLAAMGLLKTEKETVRHPVAPDFSIEIPTSDEVSAQRVDVPPEQEDVAASWEFYVEGEGVTETLTLTLAKIEMADPVLRQFAMANLLVLRSYGEIARQFPGARLIAFGPAPREDSLTAVQAVGNFQTDEGRRLIFRHVGLMADDREEALVAVINIDPGRVPVRSDAELLDTFAGRALDSLRLVPDEP